MTNDERILRELRRIQHATDRNSPGVPSYVQTGIFKLVGGFLAIVAIWWMVESAIRAIF